MKTKPKCCTALATILALFTLASLPTQHPLSLLSHNEIVANAADTYLTTLTTGGVKYELYQNSTRKYAIVTGCQYNQTTLQLPQVITWSNSAFPITAIAEEAFMSNTRLTSVDLRSALSLQTVGGKAFQDCSSLTNVIFPMNIKTVEYQAFFRCTSLRRVTFSTGCSLVKLMGSAFSYCDHLTSVVLAEGVTVVDDYCFSNCTALTYCDLPSSLCRLGNSAFASTALSGCVTIGMYVTSIGESAFAQTPNIAYFSVHSRNMTYKSVNGVLYTQSYPTLLAYPSQLSCTSFTTDAYRIAPNAFYKNAYLKTLSIPNVEWRDSFHTNFVSFPNLESVTISTTEYQKSAAKLLADYREWFIGTKVNRINGQLIAYKPTNLEPTFCAKMKTEILDHFDLLDDFSFMQAYLDKMGDYVLASTITSEMTDFEKTVKLHQWVCNRVEYDPAADHLQNEKNHRVATIFLNQRSNGHRYSVCDGYALGFQFLMKRAGIQTDVIRGISTDPEGNVDSKHTWNLSVINGTAYHIDVCWDDMDSCFDYFMQTDYAFTQDNHRFYQWSCWENAALYKGNNVATHKIRLLGDVSIRGNLSKSFAAERIQYLTDYLAGKRSFNATQMKNADLNMDGTVNVADLILMKNRQNTDPTYFEILLENCLR